MKFSASISKAETAGPSCTHSGQTNTLESAVDAFINDANGELTRCGNGTIDPGEGCDGTNLGGVTCSPPAGASLPTCKPDCTLDCSSCPNGCQVTCEPIVARDVTRHRLLDEILSFFGGRAQPMMAILRGRSVLGQSGSGGLPRMALAPARPFNFATLSASAALIRSALR